MKTEKALHDYLLLEQFCQDIKDFLQDSPQQCEPKIIQLLMQYPDAPQPQNLLGIIAEKRNDIILAMKHYRAAWALAPNYRPANANIERLVDGQYYSQCYFHDLDIQNMEKRKIQRNMQIIRRKLG